MTTKKLFKVNYSNNTWKYIVADNLGGAVTLATEVIKNDTGVTIRSISTSNNDVVVA